MATKKVVLEKRLLVNRPETLDGKTVKLDDDHRVIFRRSILPVRALNGIKHANTKLPNGLKMEYEIVDFNPVTREVTKIKSNDGESVEAKTPVKKGKKEKVTPEQLDDIFK